jgi:hypothetical protein
MSLCRSHDVLNADIWTMTNNEKNALCRLVRRKIFFDMEKITTENNLNMRTIDDITTILGSTFNIDVIICSNDTYKGI